MTYPTSRAAVVVENVARPGIPQRIFISLRQIA